MNVRYKASHFLLFFKHPLTGVSIVNWTRILFKVRFAIHPGFWLRALFISLTSLLNIPAQSVEYLVYINRIRKQRVEAPIFIVGHPRSGTTYLQYLMSQDEHFGYCDVYRAILPNNFLLGKNLMRYLVQRGLPPTRPQDEMRITIDSPKEEEFALSSLSRTSYMFGFYFPKRAEAFYKESVLFEDEKDKQHWQKHMRYFMKKLSFSVGGKQLLLKSPANTGRINEILELYPEAKFIHIHRNPLEVYQSTVKLYEKVVPLSAFQTVDNERLEAFVLDSYVSMYEKFLQAKKHLSSDQLIELTYDDLTKDPERWIKYVYEGLQLPLSEQGLMAIRKEMEAYANYTKNEYPQMDERLVDKIREKWGVTAEQLGYTI